MAWLIEIGHEEGIYRSLTPGHRVHMYVWNGKQLMLPSYSDLDPSARCPSPV